MKKRLEYKDDRSHKFWQIEVAGQAQTVRWGRIGTSGRTDESELPSEQAALEDADAQIKKKLAKGYHVVPDIDPKQYKEGPPKESGYEALQRLDIYLRNTHHPYDYAGVKFDKPMALPKIRAEEKTLGVKLPPSYVRWMTTYGPFRIVGTGDYRLMPPSEAVRTTRRVLREWEKTEDLDGIEMLKQSFLFQHENEYQSYYTFWLRNGRKDGEMPVGWFNYEDPACHDTQWDETFVDFDEHLRMMVKTIISKDE